MLRAVAKGLEAQELILASLALAAAAPLAATAQTVPSTVATDPAVRARAEALVPVLAGKPGYDTLFAAVFRQAVPAPRFASLTQSLRATLGAPRDIAQFQPIGRWAATAVVRYERGSATMRLVLDPAAPHAITGLLVTGTALAGDTAVRIRTDLAALPGTAQLGLYALDGDVPAPVFAAGGDTPAPLGSAFKLWVLAETARQVAAGMHRWDEVVPIGPRSLPSGMLQAWPAGAPVTVQTLATLMISISDNTATDTMLTLLGRDRVDAMAARYGGTVPVLTTREAFAIKADRALTTAWIAAAPAQRGAMLAAQAQRIASAPIDPLLFSSGPVASEGVEWFAAPRDMARLLASLRDAGPVVRDILSINPGIAPATAGRFGYVGFKGGSEPGVIALNVLVQAKDGRWYAVTGSWHRPDAAVEEAPFLALVTRALDLIGG